MFVIFLCEYTLTFALNIVRILCFKTSYKPDKFFIFGQYKPD